MSSMKTEGTRQRHLEQLRLQSRPQHPLIFDNSRWIASSKSSPSLTTPSANYTADFKNKNKFFEALVKPCVCNTLFLYRLLTLVAQIKRNNITFLLVTNE